MEEEFEFDLLFHCVMFADEMKTVDDIICNTVCKL